MTAAGRILFVKVTLVLTAGCYCAVEPLNQNSFPENFLFGVSSSSYQVEGAWRVDGKGENIWDRFTHEEPDRIADGSDGNVACDSYYNYKEDVQLIKDLRVNFYRFSISWSRILPTGFVNEINQDGIAYYNNLINELLANNITPMVTLYHWDLPQPLQDIGGWPNPLLVDVFVDYANVAFSEFGDRVKIWTTFNEPKQICKYGYGDGVFAPGFFSSAVGDYLCAHTVLIAHAKAYHLYNDRYRPTQNGSVGLSVHSDAYIPGSEDSSEDVAAAERNFEFLTGIYTNPIFGTGDYPQVVKDSVADRSARQNFSSSRLPQFTEEEVQLLRGTADFFGLNYYSALMVNHTEEADLSVVSVSSDARTAEWLHEDWPAAGASWQRVVPSGLRKVLKQIKDAYGDIPIYITENGFSDKGGVQDHRRVNYILTHLSACLDAIYEDDVNLVAYTAWSLLDSFEWIDGYTIRFGIHDVDFNNPERSRTGKLSSEWYTSVVINRKLPPTTIEVPENTTSSSPTSNPDDTTTEEGSAVNRKPHGLILLTVLAIGIKTAL